MKLRKILKYILISLLGLLLLFFMLLAGLFYLTVYAPFQWERFNQEKWLAHKQLGNNDFLCTRGPMVFSLRHSYLTKNLDREAVLKLLGEADYKTDGCLEYLLGMCSGLGIDYDGLVICFDETNHVTHTYTQQH